jgi:hypothetical protein
VFVRGSNYNQGLALEILGRKPVRNREAARLIPPVALTDDLVVRAKHQPRRPMETFAKLFERLLLLVYHCFDRIVIQGYLPLLAREALIVHFFRDVRGEYPITEQVLQRRTNVYRA